MVCESEVRKRGARLGCKSENVGCKSGERVGCK